MSKRRDKRQMAYTAAAMYGGAAFLSVVEGAIPGGPALSLIPGVAAMVLVTLIESVLIVAWIGVVQGAALIHLHGVLDRWIDLVVSVGIVAVVVQVLSERNDRLVARLAAEARVDKLTGVLNRRGFEERGAIEVERARREGYPVGVASFDIDYFKRVNDEWGQTPAISCSHAWARSCAPNRVRWTWSGGWAARSSWRYCQAPMPSRRWPMRSASGLPSRPRWTANVTVSAGVIATVAPEGPDELLQAADSALYAAKRGGRDRAVLHAQAPASTSPLKNSTSAL
jgi:GGDEF domain-containing protein